MTSFFKSIFRTITSANSTQRSKCPNYFHAVNVNNDSRPSVVDGFNVFVNTDVSSVFGNGPTKTTFLTNKLTLSPFGSSDVRFGAVYTSYNKNRANNPADQEPTVQTSVEADLDGHVGGQARCRVTDRASVDVWGARDNGGCGIVNAAAIWSGGRLNASAALSVVDTAGARRRDDGRPPRTTLAAECVCRLGDRWTVGGDLMADAATAAVRCSAALRHDGERATLVAAADRATNVSLRYRYGTDDDRLTVGAEATANVRDGTAVMTLINRARFGDGIEMKSQVDTNGLVVGDMHKAFPRDKYSLGVCASLDYKNKRLGLGMELRVG